MHSDQLIRLRTEGKGLDEHDFESTLEEDEEQKDQDICEAINGQYLFTNLFMIVT